MALNEEKRSTDIWISVISLDAFSTSFHWCAFAKEVSGGSGFAGAADPASQVTHSFEQGHIDATSVSARYPALIELIVDQLQVIEQVHELILQREIVPLQQVAMETSFEYTDIE
jgi:hypothetical protein